MGNEVSELIQNGLTQEELDALTLDEGAEPEAEEAAPAAEQKQETKAESEPEPEPAKEEAPAAKAEPEAEAEQDALHQCVKPLHGPLRNRLPRSPRA